MTVKPGIPDALRRVQIGTVPVQCARQDCPECWGIARRICDICHGKGFVLIPVDTLACKGARLVARQIRRGALP